MAAVQGDDDAALAAVAPIAGIGGAEVGVDIAIADADAAPGRAVAETIDQLRTKPVKSAAISFGPEL